MLRKTGKIELDIKAPVSAPVAAPVLQLTDISATLDSLPEFADDSAPTRHVHGQVVNKMKRRTAVKETEHFKAVLEHPAYLSNPLQAIKQHLENTIGKRCMNRTTFSRDEFIQNITG